MNYIKKICSFTGYRFKKLNACFASGLLDTEGLKKAVKTEMVNMLNRDFETFQCGMAVGADLMFAETALDLKQEYSPLPIKFIAVVPCLEHDRNWTENDKNRCSKVIEQADEVILVSNSRYFDGCMAKRNRYLVNNCDELLAVYDGQPGGTMQTVNFAKEKKIKITIIDPSKAVKIILIDSEKIITKI